MPNKWPRHVANCLVMGTKKPTWFNQRRCFPDGHQTFQVPKMEVLTYISCMDTAYVRENPSPKMAGYKVQETLHFRYLKLLVTTALEKFFHHAQGTEGRASPNPCFVLHASIVLGVLSIASMGLVIERSSPGNYEYHLCIAIYRGKKQQICIHGTAAMFYARTHLFYHQNGQKNPSKYLVGLDLSGLFKSKPHQRKAWKFQPPPNGLCLDWPSGTHQLQIRRSSKQTVNDGMHVIIWYFSIIYQHS